MDISETENKPAIEMIGSEAQHRFERSTRVFTKRMVDIIFSALGLILLSPVFGIIAIAIKRDSDGPVFYRGTRVGRGGKLFEMLKLPTMYECAESYHGPPLTQNGDARVTPCGAWLRETKLNELPQLWNVLIGEMSLVGPRPEDPEFVAKWPDDVRAKVLSVRPGITSPASVLYRDEEKHLNGAQFLDDYLKEILPDKLRLDQLYVDSYGFLKDLDVIFITLLAILPRLGKHNIRERTVFAGPFYRFYSKHLSWFLIDLLVAFVAVVISGLFWRLAQPLDIGITTALFLAIVIALVISVVSTLFGLHTIIWRYASPALVIDVALSVSIAAALMMLADYFLWPSFRLAPSFVLNFGLLTFMGMIAVRYRERLLTGIANRWTYARGADKKFGERVLIVGAGDGGELAIWMIHKSEYASAFSITGFVDDDYHKQKYQVAGVPVLGTTADIPRLVNKHDIGLILFSISKISQSQRNRILDLCKATKARVIAVPDLVGIIKDGGQGHFIKEIK
jgi:lipopolysaccharide/colanic/teichoic acid biosynthesis glycosyltransferase